MLKDGSLLCVFRRDGGDGVTHRSGVTIGHTHVPYVFAVSTDKGSTWALSSAPPIMLSARPRAAVHEDPSAVNS